MTSEQKVSFIESLSQNFTGVTPADAKLCWDSLWHFDLDVVTRAITAHRLEMGVKAFRPDPRRIVALCRGMVGGQADTPARERTQAYLAQQRETAETVEAEQLAVDTFIDAMDDDELSRLKAEMIANHPEMATMWERRDARRSRALRSALFVYAHPSPVAATA